MLYENSMITFIAYTMLLLGSLVTTIYSLRLLFTVFYGSHRDGDIEKISEQSLIILVPLIILSILSLISGYLIKTFVDLPIYMHVAKDIHYDGLIAFITNGILSPATVCLVLGFYVAKILYKDNKKFLILDNKYLNTITLAIKSKYKFDEFFISSSLLMKKISLVMAKKFDIGLIDGFVVNGFSKKINSFAKLLKSMSSGYLYHYAFSIVFSLVVIFGIILVRVL
jgi:NADH-quinone oxidoreductase subunit L